MTTRTSAETISKTPLEDAERLRAMLEPLKDKKISQAEFAELSGIGSQAQLWQFLNPEKKGGRPLSLMAAIAFQKGLKALDICCTVGDFSPSLQQVIDQISAHRTCLTLMEPAAAYDVMSPTAQVIALMGQLRPEQQLRVVEFASERLVLQQASEQNSLERTGS